MFAHHVTVACVVEAQGHFLLVEELIDGKRVLNQPAGHAEANETLQQAAHRELQEETGLCLEPQSIVGLYHYPITGQDCAYLRLCYSIQLPHPLPTTPQDPDILACHWLTPEDIAKSHLSMRSPMVWRCIEDYLAGRRYPLSLYQHIMANR